MIQRIAKKGGMKCCCDGYDIVTSKKASNKKAPDFLPKRTKRKFANG